LADYKPATLNGIPIPYGKSTQDLHSMIGSPGPQSWIAIRALAEKCEPEALSILINLTHSPDWRFRRSAIEAIGINPCGEKYSENIIAALSDSVGFIVRSAIEAALNLNLRQSHDKILNLIKNDEENTRITALGAIGELWQTTDFEPVFDRYLHDPSKRVHKQAGLIIYNNLDKEHWKKIFTAMLSDYIPQHRVWACELIDKFGSKIDISVLQPLLQDQNGHVRKKAMQVIELLSTKKS
jgi:HEAT repeat protein